MSDFVASRTLGDSNALSRAEWERIRPYLTVYSLSDDRSLDGKRRLNLNDVVTGTNSASRIEKEVFAIRDAITNNIPGFGLRYFSSPAAPSASEQNQYVTKIAANLRDFIDTNSIATIIQADGTAYTGDSADFVPYETLDSDLPSAFGKESGPFLSEYFRVVRVIGPEPHSSSSTPAPLTVRFAHYIELQNPTGKVINYADLGRSPFVMISKRSVWDNTSGGTPSVFRPADIKIRLPANFSIPAGGFAVLTTDGPPFGGSGSSSQSDYFGAATNRYLITAGSGPGQWELVNTGGKDAPIGGDYEDYSISVGAMSGDRFGLQNGISAGASYADQRERILFANDDGIIDYTLRIFSDSANYLGRNANNPSYYCTFISDASTTPNNTPSNATTEPRFTRGDPRSNTEVTSIRSSTSTCWKDGGAGYGASLPAQQETLGAPNFNTSQSLSGVALWRQGWYEFTADAAGNHFVANRPIQSVGELGSVYDPVRYSNDGYRSQGATLRIGQSDSPLNNRANNTGSSYMSWLGGRGSDDVANTNYMNNAFLLLDVFRSDDVTVGKVNPNCIVRDAAALAFRAALDHFAFEAASTNQSSAVLSGVNLNAATAFAALRSFATNPANGFFVSVGDLSRAPLFWGATNALAGVSMLGVSDAGREEFMRRSAGLLSTQSLAFTIFIRAESGYFASSIAGGDRFRTTATATRETVVQLRPMYAPVTDPTVPSVPTNWSIVTPRSISY